MSAQTAQALAVRAQEVFGSTWAVATTGVAGPATQEGKPVGTVFVAVDGPASDVAQLALSGDRHQIRTKKLCTSAGTAAQLDGIETGGCFVAVNVSLIASPEQMPKRHGSRTVEPRKGAGWSFSDRSSATSCVAGG